MLTTLKTEINEVYMNLYMASEGKEYTISSVKVDDEELSSFLFSLGCYSGEPITIIKRRKSGAVIALKNTRYSIDRRLAEAIEVE